MSTVADLQTTDFHDYHIQAGGEMVAFAGYSMPLRYTEGIIEEHLHTRTSAGLFDVSHMGQLVISGDGVAEGLEKLMPVDLDALAVNRQTYSVLTSEEGGILDDLIITRWDNQSFFIVVNAACKQQDISHFRQHLPNAEVRVLDQQGLLALQGPRAKEVMARLAPEANQLHFMQGCSVTIDGIDCYITRSGYTGEDGFEISVSPQHSTELAARLLADQLVRWIGLGARDSLRLEAGLCLYGQDMDRQTSPVEANLLWSISKSRRTGGSKQGGFLGADIILAHADKGVNRKRVGFVVEGRAPVREGAEIVDDTGAVIGLITSGGFAPSLHKPVAIGYVLSEFSAVGTRLHALVRGKPRAITLSSMPLVPSGYYRG